MYEDLLKDMQEKMQPMLDVAEINRKTLEKMASVQSEYLTECISCGINQAKALAEAGDAKTVADLQFKYLKEFESKLTASAEENIAAINEAKEAITELLSNTYGRIAESTPFADSATSAPVTKAPAPKKAPVRRAAKAAPKATKAPAKSAPKAATKPTPKAEPKAAPKAAPAAAAKTDAPKADAPKSAPAAQKATAPAAPKAAQAKKS
ncbi:phasin family protein [Motiliproteus sp. SC1-56]|uniref:phasin family protein n=1 Tax=Motiliproteus sp. SC1-56 TaxID=2799565 RepID=UPI001A8E01B6|nr:phasin family protein [Motiliproteus sp. SC1-56]